MNFIKIALITAITVSSNVNFAMALRIIPPYGATKAEYSQWVQKLVDQHELNASGSYDWTALHFAASTLNLDAVQELLRAGANAKAEDVFQSTPLHEVAYNCYKNPDLALAIVNALLAAKVNVNARDDQKWTPLYLAALQGKKAAAIIQVLKNAGAEDKRSNPKKKLVAIAFTACRGFRPDILQECRL